MAEVLTDDDRERFERLLGESEKGADEIALEAAGEASGRVSRTELSISAYEVAYIEAYADALPALMVTAWRKPVH
jgi:hypothetical protein